MEHFERSATSVNKSEHFIRELKWVCSNTICKAYKVIIKNDESNRINTHYQQCTDCKEQMYFLPGSISRKLEVGELAEPTHEVINGIFTPNPNYNKHKHGY